MALQQQLDVKEHEALSARRAERDWRTKLEQYGNQMTQQKEDTLDITADMSRQYKTMQNRQGESCPHLRLLSHKPHSHPSPPLPTVPSALRYEPRYARAPQQLSSRACSPSKLSSVERMKWRDDLGKQVVDAD